MSASSFILSARSLFGTDTVARIRDIVEIPEPLPFAGVKAETVHAPRYRSTFDMAILLDSARDELALSKPEQYKIFLLGAMAGLRRSEIDKLPWSAFFRWQEGVIRIAATQFFRPKSHAEGDVLVDPELTQIFSRRLRPPKGDFVIESDSEPISLACLTDSRRRWRAASFSSSVSQSRSASSSLMTYLATQGGSGVPSGISCGCFG